MLFWEVSKPHRPASRTVTVRAQPQPQPSAPPIAQILVPDSGARTTTFVCTWAATTCTRAIDTVHSCTRETRCLTCKPNPAAEKLARAAALLCRSRKQLTWRGKQQRLYRRARRRPREDPRVPAPAPCARRDRRRSHRAVRGPPQDTVCRNPDRLPDQRAAEAGWAEEEGQGERR